ncbi:MAG: bifunctional acetate--CoA ligase family protein/GNAT family N-acetyltransferase [Thaumarchaeota archaeon]|nr:bifunctional acetate--CoA ligase family protein/GNAT family N-acetyltransferase [Candidatus Calditenuaceae archaeon]MDW8187252.1 bifunctional acetate--CoA ligase family protein/GNAT family N-acetyltransferase [Nitrososphaerota archaeon]
MGSLVKMFNPAVVALIGASDKAGSIGLTLLENLMTGKSRRRIYAVNPNREQVQGLKCHPSIRDVPENVDLAIIATPAHTVPSIVEECGEAGVEGAAIISAGFKEIGEEGRRREAEIDEIRQRYGLRILGPNCMGFIRPHINLNASFFNKSPEPGQIAFISQSGALGSSILDWAVSRHIGFSMFASLGSMLDIDFGDLIDFLGQDPYTKSILLYMENVGNARKFMSAARGFARNKPIIVIKPGKFEIAAKAAKSHTGALVGSFDVYRAAFRRAGVVRVDEIQELFNCASVLDSRRLPVGPNLAIITNAGGLGVITADAVEEYGARVASLSPETIASLEMVLPSFWSRGNPIDLLGDADVERYATALRLCLNDPNVDGVIVIYTPQGAAQPDYLAESVIAIVRESEWVKPVLTVWVGGESLAEARKMFHENDIPAYETPEQAVKAYIYMYKYKRNLELLYETPEDLPIDPSPPKNFLKLLVRKALNEGRYILDFDEANKFLDVYGIPRAEGELVSTVEEAVIAARRIGYPIALKIVSPKIIHKTDVGGVVLNITSENELRKAFFRMSESIKAAISEAEVKGFYVQKMVEPVHYELIIGSKKDPDFGSVIMFGAGGVATEFLMDKAVGLPPLNQVLARRIMEETKIYDVLQKGLRNKPPANLKKIEETIVRFSNIIVDFPEIKEAEINPLIVAGERVVSADCRILLDPDFRPSEEPYQHLVISPYPTKYVRPWRLKDGRMVLLRPIKPEDEPIEYELIKGLSEESSRFRFFQVIREITHEMLVRFCNIDYDREMAIIAEYREDGKVRNIGVGRLIMQPDRKRAEFAVLVADDFQGKGLGTKLIDTLIEVAQERKISTIYGIILPDNVRMINLAKKMGFTIKRRGEDVYVELKLDLEKPAETRTEASRQQITTITASSNQSS